MKHPQWEVPDHIHMCGSFFMPSLQLVVLAQASIHRRVNCGHNNVAALHQTWHNYTENSPVNIFPDWSSGHSKILVCLWISVTQTSNLPCRVYVNFPTAWVATSRGPSRNGKPFIDEVLKRLKSIMIQCDLHFLMNLWLSTENKIWRGKNGIEKTGDKVLPQGQQWGGDQPKSFTYWLGW